MSHMIIQEIMDCDFHLRWKNKKSSLKKIEIVPALETKSPLPTK